jgi:hypothetical protein
MKASLDASRSLIRRLGPSLASPLPGSNLDRRLDCDIATMPPQLIPRSATMDAEERIVSARALRVAPTCRTGRSVGDLADEIGERIVAERRLTDTPMATHAPIGFRPCSGRERVWVKQPISGVEQVYDVPVGELERLPDDGDIRGRDTALLSYFVSAGIIACDGDRADQGALQVSRLREHLMRNHFVIIRNVVNPVYVGILRRHFRRLRSWGYFVDDRAQVPTRDGVYSEFVSLYLQDQLVPLVSQLVNSTVRPSYTWYFRYRTGSVLARHTDRPQCRWNMSFAVDVEPDDAEEHWPFSFFFHG